MKELLFSIILYGKGYLDFSKPIANQPIQGITLQFKDRSLENAFLEYESKTFFKFRRMFIIAILIMAILFLYDDLAQPIKPIVAFSLRLSVCGLLLVISTICFTPGITFTKFREIHFIPHTIILWEVLGSYICYITITIGYVTSYGFQVTQNLAYLAPQLLPSPVTLIAIYGFAICARMRFFSTLIFGVILLGYYSIGWLTVVKLPLAFYGEHHFFTVLIILVSYLTITYGLERVRRAQFIRRTEIIQVLQLFSHVPLPSEISGPEKIKESNDVEKKLEELIQPFKIHRVFRRLADKGLHEAYCIWYWNQHKVVIRIFLVVLGASLVLYGLEQSLITQENTWSSLYIVRGVAGFYALLGVAVSFYPSYYKYFNIHMSSVVLVAAAAPLWAYSTTELPFQQRYYSLEIFRIILASASTCRIQFFPQLLVMWTIAISFGVINLQMTYIFRAILCNLIAMFGCWTMQQQAVHNFVLKEIQKHLPHPV